MKILAKSLMAAVVLSVFSLAAPVAHAMTPTLSITREGGSDSYRISVYGDSNGYINKLAYRTANSSLWTEITGLGQLDGSGHYTTVLGFAGSAPAEMYVTVNGQQSSMAYPGGGCTGWNCGGNNTLTLTPSSLSMRVGESATVQTNAAVILIYPPVNAVYVSSNTNPSVASASVQGTSLTVHASQIGSTTMTVCANGISGCASLYVNVSGTGGSGTITFSQSNVTVNPNQTVNVYIYSSSNSSSGYYIGSNSNSSVVDASISGSTLYLTGRTNGSSTITVCQYSGNCGYVYVNSSGQGNITFSDSNPSLTVNQSRSIYIHNSGGSSSSYYISNNSNSSVVTATVTGNELYLLAKNTGTSTITVCQYSGNCGTVNVTVSGSGSGSFWLSQSSLNLNVGQTSTVQAYTSGYYGSGLYISNNTNSYVASPSVSGNTVTVYGNNQGNTTITVCSSSVNQCQSLYVTVQGGQGSGNLYFMSTSLPQMYVNQYYNHYLQVSGGASPYNYTVMSGSLPAGISLSSSGQLFGTPQNTNNASFTVRVSDNYGRTATQYFTVTPTCVSGSYGCVLGSSQYPNGSLFSENGTVYMVYRGTKTGFSSAEVFRGLGFSFAQVQNIGFLNLPNTGYVINSQYTSHPWGTWIKSGNTIYFVHEQGLIPVPSYSVFLNNGGQDRFVVAANSWDFTRPGLSVMTDNDPRLR